MMAFGEVAGGKEGFDPLSPGPLIRAELGSRPPPAWFSNPLACDPVGSRSHWLAVRLVFEARAKGSQRPCGVGY